MNKARLLFVLSRAEACRPFLTRLQAQKPLIHELLPRCCQLFLSLAEDVMLPEKIPATSGAISSLNLKDSSLYREPGHATYMRLLTQTLEGVDRDEKKKLAEEFMSASKAQLQYLKEHLPFNHVLYRSVLFADPTRRKEPELQNRGNTVANIFKRFSESEKAKILVQLGVYKTLPDDQVPPFDEVNGRVDHCTMCTLVSIFTSQPNKLRPTVKVVF